MKKIYLIDFDGTITSKDSFIIFTLFSTNFINFLKYWVGVILFFQFQENSFLKESFFKNFKGIDSNLFDSLCESFNKIKLNNMIKKSFTDYIFKIDENSKVVIVSASIKNYLKPWCDKMGFDLLSTELEVFNGKMTGKFSTPNCNGHEKVIRINQQYDLSAYDEIHVFGNSKGDLPMLELGTHKYYKFFK